MGTQVPVPLRPATGAATASVGEPCHGYCKKSSAQVRRRMQRLWPAHGYKEQARTDPWGAAYQRAAREEAVFAAASALYHAKPSSFKPSSSFESDWAAWERAVREAGRHARSLGGEDALREIMACLTETDSFPPRENPDCASLVRNRRVAVTALLYIACGHELHRIQGWPSTATNIAVSAARGRNYNARKHKGVYAGIGEAAAAILVALPAARPSKKRRKALVAFGLSRRKNALPIRVYPLKASDAGKPFGIGCIAGPRGHRHRVILKRFDNRTEAEDFLRSRKPEVFRLLWRWYNLPFKGNSAVYNDAIRWNPPPRRGPPRRSGDVSSNLFFQTFAPKGITFGEDVDPAHRQRMLNVLFDQATDLADLVGCARSDLFFNGGVGLALGLAPWGTSLAHYSPIQRHIFLNKDQGGDAFVHEWFHALVHFIDRSVRYSAGERNHPDATKLFCSTISSCSEPGMPSYYERTLHFEKRFLANKEPIWIKDSELAARAFEALARREAVRRNWRHTPVAGLPDWHLWRNCANGHKFPYPTPWELTQCAETLWRTVREGLDFALKANSEGKTALAA